MSERRHSAGGHRGPVAALAVAALLTLPTPASAAINVADFRAKEDTAERKIFAGGGLRLRASCDESGDIHFFAKTKADNAVIAVARQHPAGANYLENTDFDTTDLAFNFDGVDDSVSGQLIYANPNGRITTVDYLAEDSDPGGDGIRPHGAAYDCAFHGIGRTAGPGSGGRVKFTKTEGTAAGFLGLGGLELSARCDPDDFNLPADPGAESDMVVFLENNQADAVLHVNRQFDPGDGHDYFEEDDFDPGVTNLVDPFSREHDDQSAGQIVYSRPGGVNVTVDWAAQVTADGDLLGSKDCAFVGTARKRGPGDDRRLNHRLSSGVGNFKRFTKGGLTLQTTCQSGDLDTRAFTKADDAMIHFNRQGPGTGVGYAERDNWSSNEQVPLFSNLGADDSLAGQIIYAQRNGKVVSVDWLAEESSDLYGGTKDCAFVGTAEVAAP